MSIDNTNTKMLQKSRYSGQTSVAAQTRNELPEPPLKEITQQVEYANILVQDISAELSALEGRLSPVMNSGGNGEGDVQGQAPLSTHLGACLHKQNLILEEFKSRLQAINERLEL